MMGTSHAISGAAAWVAITSSVPIAASVMPLEATAVTAGAVICAGAALLPDADHPSATIAHSVPVVGAAAAGAVGAATGGHRHGMHSLLAVGVTLLATWWLGTLLWTPAPGWPTIAIGGVIVTLALVTFAVKVLKLTHSWPRAWLIGAVAAAVLAIALPTNAFWLPVCVTLGYLVHLLGDMLTVGGVPLLWPIPAKPPKAVATTPLGWIWKKNGYFAVPILGSTGSPAEAVLGFALGAYTLAALGWMWVLAAGI